ncbi:MAG: hypothetical protein AB8G26_14835 [Ilumatobacter sp.]
MHSDSTPRPARRSIAWATTSAVFASILAIGAPAASADAAANDLIVDGLDTCQTGSTCTFVAGGLAMSAGADLQADWTEAGDVILRGTLRLAGGAWTTAERELAFEAVDGGHRFVGGTARFADLETPVIDLVDLPSASVGFASGHDLAARGAHVDPDRAYWYFVADAGVTFAPGSALDGGPGAFAPLRAPASASFTFVLDPTDPYAYVGGSCDVLGSVVSAISGPEQDRSEARNDHRTNDADTNHHDANESTTGGERRTFGEVAAHIATYVAGDCGLGISASGNIPVVGIAGTDDFGAHLVVDAPIVAPFATSIAGTSYLNVDQGIRLAATGQISLGLAPFGDLLGASIPLGSAAVDMAITDEWVGVAVDGVLSTRDGYTLPLLRNPVSFPADAHVRVGARFGGDPSGADAGIDPESFLSLNGEFQLLDIDLFGGSLRVDRTGATVNAMMSNGITTYEVEGHVGSDGARMTGRALIELPLDLIGDGADMAIAAAQDARRDVDLLQIQMDDTRDDIREERRAVSSTLSQAADDVASAKSGLEVIDRNISVNNKKISYLKRRISNERRWYKRLAWHKKPRYAARTGARIAAWSTAIGGLRTANTANHAARATAVAVLDLAEDGVRSIRAGIDALPTDTDPRMIALIAAHAVAPATLKAFEGVADQFRFTSSYHGSTEGTFGTSMAGGAFDLVSCDDSGCRTIVAGSLTADDDGTIGCVTPVVGAPEVCVRL